jgi:hypothetical protein
MRNYDLTPIMRAIPSISVLHEGMTPEEVRSILGEPFLDHSMAGYMTITYLDIPLQVCFKLDCPRKVVMIDQEKGIRSYQWADNPMKPCYKYRLFMVRYSSFPY